MNVLKRRVGEHAWANERVFFSLEVEGRWVEGRPLRLWQLATFVKAVLKCGNCSTENLILLHGEEAKNQWLQTFSIFLIIKSTKIFIS